MRRSYDVRGTVRPVRKSQGITKTLRSAHLGGSGRIRYWIFWHIYPPIYDILIQFFIHNLPMHCCSYDVLIALSVPLQIFWRDVACAELTADFLWSAVSCWSQIIWSDSSLMGCCGQDCVLTHFDLQCRSLIAEYLISFNMSDYKF